MKTLLETIGGLILLCICAPFCVFAIAALLAVIAAFWLFGACLIVMTLHWAFGSEFLERALGMCPA